MKKEEAKQRYPDLFEKGESKEEPSNFMHACMRHEFKEKGKPYDQAVAICMSMSRREGNSVKDWKRWKKKALAKEKLGKSSDREGIDYPTEQTLEPSIFLHSP